MKNRKKMWIAAFVLMIGLVFTGCSTLGAKLPDEATAGVFVKNPAPPVCKELTDQEELKELLSVLKGARLTEINDVSEQERLSAQGWSAWIRLIDEEDQDHDTLDTAWSIAIYGEEVLSFEKTFYQVPEKVTEQLLDLYEESGAEEQDYNDYLAREIVE